MRTPERHDPDRPAPADRPVRVDGPARADGPAPADRPARVLLAPDSFKGTFDAPVVAAALAEGVLAAGAQADACPVADGGEGTLDVLLAARGGALREAAAHDPLGRPLVARFALLDGGATAVVETAEASGLNLVPEAERDAEAASTAGTGELVAAAVAAGARHVLLGVGGSGTTDGGAGAIAAIEAAGGLRGARLTILCDVTTPFEDAARVYGPQKGADPTAVERLTARLHAAAERLPRDPRGLPMTGAAGGLSGGLWAALGAELVPGAPAVLDAVGFDARLAAADAVVAGEGRIDNQSLQGKIVGEIAARAARAGVPLHAVVGSNGLAPGERERLGLASVTAAPTLADVRAAGEALATSLRG